MSNNTITQAELTTSNSCEWIGEGERCNHSAVPGRNYCTDHIWLVYAKGTAVRRRPRKEKQLTDAQDFCAELQELYTEMVAQGEV